MSVTFTQLKQTINLAEKVKVDSGEKIVKTDKVGRKKNIEVTVTTKGGKYFVYFDKEVSLIQILLTFTNHHY